MMKITQLFTLLVITFTLTSCLADRSTHKVPYYQEVIDDWVGKSLDRIVKSWRIGPDKTYYRGGMKYVEWKKTGYYLRGGAPNIELVCTYTFELSRRNIIVAGKAEGIDCPKRKGRFY